MGVRSPTRLPGTPATGYVRLHHGGISIPPITITISSRFRLRLISSPGRDSFPPGTRFFPSQLGPAFALADGIA
jgi:hypothetical protein